MQRLRRIFFLLMVLSFVLTTHLLTAQNDPASDVIAGGTVLTDVEFRADGNGFGFPNYGGEEGYVDLTSAEMVRLFGEQICYSAVNEFGECELIPNAEMWMHEINEYMAGGHCEGMAVLSALFFAGIMDPAEFGADFVSDLSIQDNEWLQREIAFWWSLQGVSPVPDMGIFGSPTAVGEALIDGFGSGQELYTIGIYAADGTGGHAITPYAVVEMGDDIYRILVYDNNYPFEERFIEVDAQADSWVYTGSTNPNEPESEYFGDAQTQSLSIYPITARLEESICPFCDGAENSSISLNGRGSMVVTDEEGRQTGLVNGVYVNNIPGASIRYPRNLGGAYRAPVINIPRTIKVTVMITSDPNNTDGGATQISITQGGKIAHLSGFELSDKNTTLEVDETSIHYDSENDADAIKFEQGIMTGDGEHFLYTLQGTGEFEFTVDAETGDFDVSGGEDAETFSLSVKNIDEDGNVQEYPEVDISLTGEETSFSPDDWSDGIISEVDDDSSDDTSDDGTDDAADDTSDESTDDVADEPVDDTGGDAGEPIDDTGGDDGGGEEGGD
jgi:hypothetical protein